MARNTRAKKKVEEPKVEIGAEIFASLNELEKQKGIPVNYMVERLKQALTNAYRKDREAGESLADYLEKRVFAAAAGTCVDPDPEDRAGFQTYIARYKAGLAVEKAAAEALA